MCASLGCMCARQGCMWAWQGHMWECMYVSLQGASMLHEGMSVQVPIVGVHLCSWGFKGVPIMCQLCRMAESWTA